MRSLLIYIAAFLVVLCAATVFGTPSGSGDDPVSFDEPAESLGRVLDSVVPDSEIVPAVLGEPTGDSQLVVPATRLPWGPSQSRVKYVKVDLENSVIFSSEDSMLIIKRDSAFMYGDGDVQYGDIKLAASEIRMDLTDNTVFAIGRPDSTGEVQGKPVFTENGTEYEAATMRYNFKSGKGYIQNVVTQQGEGYLTGGTTKKDSTDAFYIANGRYTTCDHHDNPHFYFQITKAKMRPGKNIVVGPAYMVLAGLPLPLAVPFGYFPFTDKYASGVIVPTFGDDYNRGFYLRDGGYYFAINDNVDLALTGEVYTKGSWGIAARSSYAKRYKFNGSFNLSYLKTILGEKGSPDYGVQTNFMVHEPFGKCQLHDFRLYPQRP